MGPLWEDTCGPSDLVLLQPRARRGEHTLALHLMNMPDIMMTDGSIYWQGPSAGKDGSRCCLERHMLQTSCYFSLEPEGDEQVSKDHLTDLPSMIRNVHNAGTVPTLA